MYCDFGISNLLPRAEPTPTQRVRTPSFCEKTGRFALACFSCLTMPVLWTAGPILWAAGKAGQCWRERQVAKVTRNGKLFHGTTFSALYLMGMMEEDHRNVLFPFGFLARVNLPVFSGETFRGIKDDGINQTSTSWADLDHVENAIGYSKKFPFNPQPIVTKLNYLIEGTAHWLAGRTIPPSPFDLSTSSIPPYVDKTCNAQWNQLILQIRQLRAWDPDGFERQFARGLQTWIDACRTYLQPQGADLHSKMKQIEQELQKPPAFRLKAQDRQAIADATPIVFITNSYHAYSIPTVGEYAIQSPLKLGYEIRALATSDPQKITRHLQAHGLANRITVITLDELAAQGKKHAAS